MDANKKSIRPTLHLKSAQSEIENFQNTVLRPVLKLQNDILVKLAFVFFNKQKLIFSLSIKTLPKNIDVFLKNIVFRNQLLGIIIGQFTIDEFEVYEKNQSEYNKRIIVMIKQRLLNQIENNLL